MKRRLVVAVLLLAGVTGGIVLAVRDRSAAAPTPVAEPSPPPAPRPASPRLVPMRPRWETPSGTTPPTVEPRDADLPPTHSAVTFSNGMHAELRALRERFPRGSMVEMEMRLADASGAPIAGRVDTVVMINETGVDPYKTRFVEYPEEPGLYKLRFAPRGERPGHVGVTAIVSEEVAAESPRQGLTATVLHGAPARFTRDPTARVTADGVVIRIPLHAIQPTHVAVRGELRDRGGTSLGETTTEADVQAGDSWVELAFPPTTATDLVVHDATLFVGTPGEWADFWAKPRAVQQLN